jgi:hypothetical protein
LLKKAEVELIGMRDGKYYIVKIIPVNPKKPYVNKFRPSKELLDGSIVLSCINKSVQEGLAREIKKCSKMRFGGDSEGKGKQEVRFFKKKFIFFLSCFWLRQCCKFHSVWHW